MGENGILLSLNDTEPIINCTKILFYVYLVLHHPPAMRYMKGIM